MKTDFEDDDHLGYLIKTSWISDQNFSYIYIYIYIYIYTDASYQVPKHLAFWFRRSKQEAHGPQVAHLSDIATADMQMLCNIFPILSSQLMKRSSFKQFFILKKKIYGMPVN